MIYVDLKQRPINVGGPTLEQKYGIEVVSFVLRETRFGEKLAEASEEKKRRELIRFVLANAREIAARLPPRITSYNVCYTKLLRGSWSRSKT